MGYHGDSSYKKKRTARVATELVAFQKGMFIATRYKAGHAKMLVNYDLIDNGKPYVP